MVFEQTLGEIEGFTGEVRLAQMPFSGLEWCVVSQQHSYRELGHLTPAQFTQVISKIKPEIKPRLNLVRYYIDIQLRVGKLSIQLPA